MRFDYIQDSWFGQFKTAIESLKIDLIFPAEPEFEKILYRVGKRE